MLPIPLINKTNNLIASMDHKNYIVHSVVTLPSSSTVMTPSLSQSNSLKASLRQSMSWRDSCRSGLSRSVFLVMLSSSAAASLCHHPPRCCCCCCCCGHLTPPQPRPTDNNTRPPAGGRLELASPAQARLTPAWVYILL